MKCCECGAEINHVLVNHFAFDGTDALHMMELEDMGMDVIPSLQTLIGLGMD